MNRVRGTIEYLRSALWFVPLIAIPLELVLSRLFHQIDARLDWTLLGLGPAGARAVLEVTVTMTLSFIVFTFGSLLVAIQVRAANSPRGSSRRRCCATMSCVALSGCSSFP